MKVEINEPFVIVYDRKSGALSLTQGESASGRQVIVAFSPAQTRALYNSLLAVRRRLGEPPGTEIIAAPQH